MKKQRRGLDRYNLLHDGTFNCKNIKTCAQTFHDLLKEGDIFLVQEHWLFDYELSLLDELH